jgi:GT2 family glycosyltransferase
VNSITVGIPTLNRSEFLKKTVLSVIKNAINNIDEIIIVDQTIEQETINNNKFFFKNLNFKIRYIILNEPSVCKARNIIINESKSDIIFFIDDDVILSKNYFNEHIKLYQFKDVVSTIGKIYNRNHGVSIDLLNIDEPDLYTNDPFYNKENIETNYTGPGISCNQSYLRKILLEVRGFDENFKGGYYEDADLANRIRNNGYKIGFNPKAYIIHIKAPMGGLRFDKIQPISIDVKFYSFIFYYIRNFELTFKYLLIFFNVLRAGPLKKENVLNIKNSLLLWIKLPFLLYKAIKDRNVIKSIIN